ncbi:MAG: hypothetical protein AAF394_01075, partial [Planctomycetota bacterium]
MTKKKNGLRAAFQSNSREELGILHDELLGAGAANREFLSKLNRSQFAELRFEKEAGVFRYHLTWSENGQLKQAAGAAHANTTSSGRGDWALEGFPATIEALSLLEGDFDREFFPVRDFVLALPHLGDQVELGESTAANAANAPVYALGAQTHKTDDEEPELGSVEKTEEPNWRIQWSSKKNLTITYDPKSTTPFEDLPAVVSVEYLDDDGYSQSRDMHVCLAKHQDVLGASVWKASLNPNDISYPGDGVQVNVKIRPVTKNDIIHFGVSNDDTGRDWLRTNFLANREFNAYVGKLDTNKMSFHDVPESFPNANKSYGIKFVPKHEEAQNGDVR